MCRKVTFLSFFFLVLNLPSMGSELDIPESVIRTADLIEIDQEGVINPDLEKELTIHQDPHFSIPNTITFYEEKKINCSVASCEITSETTEFEIVARKTDGCGSISYQAYEVTFMDNTTPRVFTLTDHTERPCDDIEGPPIQGTLTQNEEKRIFKGMPKL